MNIKPEDDEFVRQAKAFTSRVGPKAVLLLVGSRAAGFADTWSDLDMWVVGNKTGLLPAERERYEQNTELFIDRGDYEAHWSFFDQHDLQSLLQHFPDEKMWILINAQVLFCDENTSISLKQQCQQYPSDAIEPKLKWHFGNYWRCLGPLNMAARGMPETAFLMTGMAIKHLCKLCCLAERKPFPYSKWLIPVARETVLGRRVCSSISRSIFGIDDFLHPPKGKHYKELIPLKELRDTKEVVIATLKELQWSCSWIENTGEAVAETMKEHNNRVQATR